MDKNIEEKCENCGFCKELKIRERKLDYIGKNNCISGIKIKVSNSRYNDSLCCLAFYDEDTENPIFETKANDVCERFIPRDDILISRQAKEFANKFINDISKNTLDIEKGL